MVITVCIGSSCHLKGSRDIVHILNRLITLHNVEDKIELNGSFCMGRCVEGVCVTIDGEQFSLDPNSTENFFKDDVLGRLNK